MKTAIISIIYTQSQLLAKEIYLIDRIENRKREKMRHLKCIAFCRPTAQSIQYLTEELREPCFGEYYLCMAAGWVLMRRFHQRCPKIIHREVRLVAIQEYYADYVAIAPDLFSLNVTSPEYSLFVESSKTWDNAALSRVTEGVTGVLLSLKKKPLIRYENNSSLARKLAAELTYAIQNEGPLYDFRKTDTPPILLIMDRRNDPVTPLLNQWTYQAMIHELLGITNGRVDLSQVKDIRDEVKEIVLNIEHDQFFQNNMYLNLGELGANIKTYVDEFQQKHNSTKKIESVADMKRFVEDYPEFRKLSGNVAKHVALVGELSRKVGADHLLDVGELEQSLAVSNSHSADAKLMEGFLADATLSVASKLKLVLLYALRYEKTSNNLIKTFTDALKIGGASEKQLQLCQAILQYAGSEVRMEATGSMETLLDTTKNVFKGLKGVENVYTQHVPRLATVVQDAIKGKLKDSNYPFFEGSTKDK
ncbi:vacuolar protein sorting-associated protein 45 [Kappamyces sp. JEL0680]|nr:vacuolar protein sorting-associated protein 45 [Kappamyces sp. JEL0680]